MNGIESIFLGLINSKASLTGLGIADSLQNRLFATPNFTAGLQIDLPATNINRGRDHGIQAYAAYRRICNMTDVNNFDDLKNGGKLNNDVSVFIITFNQGSMGKNENDTNIYIDCSHKVCISCLSKINKCPICKCNINNDYSYNEN